MKNVLLIATGGTIASTKSERGLSPEFDVEQLVSYVPDITNVCNITGRLIMSIDSTNMTPGLMIKIAAAIYENYDNFDGFVVTHGTDTMGYTSACLTYMLQNIKKPVVVTGSQIAIDSLCTDAKKNISDAIIFSLEDIGGVYVAFDGKIINGVRAMKVRTKSMNAFDSINFPCIAEVKLGRIIYNKDLYGYNPVDATKPFALKTKLCTDIFVLKIIPGMDAKIYDYIKGNYKGVIIESFGVGGIPTEGQSQVEKIRELCEAGLAVVITTQCLEEGVDLGIYEVGTALAKHKIIVAGDMITEALVAKLWWALGNFECIRDIKYFMESPVSSDITL